jgi:hypothetical protein
MHYNTCKKEKKTKQKEIKENNDFLKKAIDFFCDFLVPLCASERHTLPLPLPRGIPKTLFIVSPHL